MSPLKPTKELEEQAAKAGVRVMSVLERINRALEYGPTTKAPEKKQPKPYLNGHD